MSSKAMLHEMTGLMKNEHDKHDILVIGSANMDMVVRCERFPQPGETVFGGEFGMYPGGKGANQAVACARLGGHVHFVGKMGHDLFRDKLTESLQQDNIDLDALLSDEEAPTGIALIAVDGSGENQITVVAGSNMKLRADEVEAREDLFEEAAVVLLQLEIPLETVERAATLGQRHGATVILNPAPACELPEKLLANVDLLTPNESEAALLTGIEGRGEAFAECAGRALLERGVAAVIVTLGAGGALLVTPERQKLFPVPQVEVVDTTAAGDAFNGALSYALAAGADLDEAIELANATATYVVTRRGAQVSMPTRSEVDQRGDASSNGPSRASSLLSR